MSLALRLFFIITILLKKYDISNFSEYKINVPLNIVRMPRYWIPVNSSPKKNSEKKELNSGENDSSGIVKLKSDSLIDLRKISAEKIPKISNEIPGSKYKVKLKKKLSFRHHPKKNTDQWLNSGWNRVDSITSKVQTI